MTNENDQNGNEQIHGEFPDVLGPLGQLRDAIDAQEYPGEAWSPPTGSKRRVWVALGGVCAAAAAVMLAIGVSVWMSGRDSANGGTTSPAISAPASSQSLWAIPTDIAPAAVAKVTLSIPSISLTPMTQADGFEWSLPTVSFSIE